MALYDRCSQQTDSWTVFWDKKEENFGFKDQNGKVKIQPKFGFMSFVKRLDYVFIASEVKDDKVDLYYLTKSGKSFGRDSVYFWDNTPDCESEGFIRFRDRETEKVGMFNRNGEVVIPAIYNELSQVKNGLVIALIDAKKKYWEEHDHSGCNHFSWTDGKTLLIDTTNRIIIENFKNNSKLNLYSLEYNFDPITPILGLTCREIFQVFDKKTKENPKMPVRYCSFIDYEQEFSIWLQKSLLDNFTLENLRLSTSNNIFFWKDGKGWISKPSDKILEKNFELLKDRLSKIGDAGQDYFISIDGLNQGIFEGKEYDIYFNNCGQSLTDKYPVMKIVITHKNGNDINQDHFDFLKTENGYKLISLTIKNGRIEE